MSAQAKMSLLYLLASARMSYLAELHKKGELTPEIASGESRFESAVYTAAAFTHPDYEKIDVTQMKVHGVNEGETVSSTSLELESDSLIQSIHITEAEDKVKDCTYSIRPIENEFLSECQEKLDLEDFSNISLKALSGIFADESALDELLEAARANYHGTSREDKVNYLLSEVRLRSLAAKEALEMNYQFMTGLPTLEFLDKVSELFE